jgi:nitrate reductase assembly molybdenum cofactor insertion protein NarJ
MISIDDTQTYEQTADLAARRIVARALAAAFADPRSSLGRRPFEYSNAALCAGWGLVAARCGDLQPGDLGLGEVAPPQVDFEPVVRWLHLDPIRRERTHQRVFGLVISRQCPPYETEFVPWKDVTHRAQKLADIAGFYNGFGLEPSGASPERPDHVSLELEFVAFLLQKTLVAGQEADPAGDEHAALCRDGLTSFVAEHVAWWMPTFARCLERRLEQVLAGLSEGAERDDATLLGDLAPILAGWVAAERRLLGIAPVRRLIGPEVPPPDVQQDDGCAACVCGGPAVS